MLNTYRISLLTKSFLTSRISHLFASKSKLFDLKNNSIALIQTQQQQLPYMSQIQLQNQNKGIVLKIQQNGTTYLGMYHQINPNNITPETFTIKNVHKNWKSSSNQLVQNIIQKTNTTYGIYDVNCNLVQASNISQLPQVNQQQRYELTNGNKRRLKSSSPILNLSQDLYYGDMISFMGCRGSKKSQNSWIIAKQFVNENQNNLPIYVNPFLNEVKQFSKKCPNSISFTVPKSQKPTDAGVYMLALKAINLAIQLKNKGKNVLLILDNLTHIMVREWSLLQAIKFNSKAVDSSKLFQYNSLKIPPISILNEVYSNCQDNNPSKQKSQGKKTSKGSLTSILIAENQNNQLVQQITTFSNNIKHLQTLSKVIEFPLNFKVNTNLYYKKPASEQQFNEIRQEKGFQEKDLHRFLRSYINRYLNEKKETELKRQLYKNDIKDAPWDYFFILDAQWCTKGIKQMSPIFTSFKESNNFLRWIVFNIQNDLLGHWSISAKQAYLKLVTYLKNQNGLAQSTPLSEITFTDEDLESFLDDCRMQGLVSPFKKDYLI